MKNFISLFFILMGGLLHSQTTIPFELIENRIVVDVKINENEYKFALDFQKNYLIAQDLLEENKLDILSNEWYPNGNNDSVIANDVMVNQLQIGDLKFIKQVFTAVDFSNFRINNIHIDGFLGMSMFSNYVLELDFIRRQIQLREKGYLPTGNAFKVTIYSDKEVPYVMCSINNQMCNLALDFSINAPIMLHNSFFKNDLKVNLTNNFSKMGNDLFEGVFAQATVINNFRLREINAPQLEAHVVQNKTTYMYNSTIVGGIGTQLFLDRVLFFDFDKKSLWIK